MFSVQHDNKFQIWTWEILQSEFKFVSYHSFLIQTLNHFISLSQNLFSTTTKKKGSEIHSESDKHLEIKVLALKMDFYTSYAS